MSSSRHVLSERLPWENIEEEKPMTTYEGALTSKTSVQIEAERPTTLLVTIPQAASLLAISRSTVYELIWRHELEPIKIGRSVRLRMADLEAFARGAHEAIGSEEPDASDP